MVWGKYGLDRNLSGKNLQWFVINLEIWFDGLLYAK
jgi:hypothetical protein